jgi:hypothetical protein
MQYRWIILLHVISRPTQHRYTAAGLRVQYNSARKIISFVYRFMIRRVADVGTSKLNENTDSFV